MNHKTDVAIIGSGPSGLFLAHLLHQAGIESIVIDRVDREYILSRIRAGVLEWGSVEALREADVGERMDAEGLVHNGFDLAFDGEHHRIDLKGLTGVPVMVYGQTELTRDLFDRREADGGKFIFGVQNVMIDNPPSDSPSVQFTIDGEKHTIECNEIAGCDGFHGVARNSIPADVLRTYERVYPFGWLGVLVDKPPVADELIYSNHERGFALCSMRSATRSRYYVQVGLEQKVEDWSDERFWDELKSRLNQETANELQTGESIEKSIAPLRSFVAEPMSYNNLFLAGDAAHIVPPTGAKGLNLAVSDVMTLANALEAKYKKNDTGKLASYSDTALRRIWKSERFSWYLSTLMHQFPENSGFENRMQRAEFDYVKNSEAASKAIAENYIGLPIEY